MAHWNDGLTDAAAQWLFTAILQVSQAIESLLNELMRKAAADSKTAVPEVWPGF